MSKEGGDSNKRSSENHFQLFRVSSPGLAGWFLEIHLEPQLLQRCKPQGLTEFRVVVSSTLRVLFPIQAAIFFWCRLDNVVAFLFFRCIFWRVLSSFSFFGFDRFVFVSFVAVFVF